MHESLEQKLDISESNKLGDIYRELLEERSYRNADKLASVMTFWLKLFEVGRSTGVVLSGSSLNLIECMCEKDGLAVRKKPIGKMSLIFKIKKFLWIIASFLPLSSGLVR